MTDAEQREAARQFINSWRKGGGEQLTPYEQAKRYNDNLPLSEKARWIVTSNFLEIWIYDMEATVPEPTKLSLPELQNKYTLLDFLIKKDMKQLSHEMEVSIQAGDIVGLLYNAFLKQYGIPDTIPKKETAEEKAKREFNRLELYPDFDV